MEFYDIMLEACKSVDMEFNEHKYNNFMLYKELLKEWNEKINLTAIIEDEDIVKKHFIDCIKAFKSKEFKQCKTIVDIGTGAGFPGLPLAIMRDDVEVTLIDSLNKRVNYLNEVISKLGLKNVVAIHSRAEDGARDIKLREKFDIATSRAVANMCVLSELCIPYVKKNGYFIALKGPAVEEELSEAKNAISTLGAQLKEVVEVEIEGTDLRHNLVVINKVKETPGIYPRKAGTITKKPLK